MELRVIAIVAGIFFCSDVSAQTPAWSIQPNICVAQRVGDECQLTFRIETQNMPAEPLCLFLDGQLINCSKNSYVSKETSISINKNVLIELKNKAQKTIVSKKLLVKYLDLHDHRRRVRPPWSLF